MKIAEQAKRGAAAFAAVCALAASTVFGAAAPALADPVVPISGDNTVTLTKTLKGADATLPDAQEFTFHFEKTALTEVGAAGVAETPTINDAKITIGTADGNNLFKETDGTTATLTQNLVIDISNITFPHAGLYAWTVTETGTVADVTMSQASYVLRIYHKVDGTNVITVEKAKDDAGAAPADKTKVDPNPVDPDEPDKPVNPNNPDSHKSGFIFNNVMVAGAIDGDNNLKIYKYVYGDLGDLTRAFQFHLTLAKPANATATTVVAKVYDFSKGNPQQVGGEIVFTYGQTVDFTMKGNQMLKFDDGMVDGTTYLLVEDGAPNYTASAEANVGNDRVATASKAADGQSAIAEGNGMQLAAFAKKGTRNEANVVNMFPEVSPTGIAISVLPYAVMVLVPVAGAAAWIVSRRRNGMSA